MKIVYLKMLKYVIVSILFLPFFSSCFVAKKEKVDAIIHHGIIYSVDSAFTIYEAMCIKDGKIIDVGTNETILQKYDAATIQDLEGKAAFPGFIDAHCHFLGYGLSLQQCNLTGSKSKEEMIQRVVEFSHKLNNQSQLDGSSNFKKSHEDWLIGYGWDQNDWENKEFPDNAQLDSLFPNIPVLLYRVDGHAALVNSTALKIAGITEKSKLDGGDFIKKNNRLTGILLDNSMLLVKSILPNRNNQILSKALLEAQQNCLAVGLTTIDDAGLMKHDIDLIDELQKSNKLKMRMYVMLSDSTPNYDYYLKHGPYKTDRLNVRSFKFYADGALGSRGACLQHDYNDKANWKGFLLNNQKHFDECAALLINKGFQMNTHCIGDSAYHIILNAYQKAGLKKEQRWRIEHAQVVSPNDMQLSDVIIPSVQPTHATSDMYWAKDRLGDKRVSYAYAYKDLLNKTGLIALGTDFPIEDISPFKTFFAAVARQDSKGFPDKGFQTENALSREETLKGMTIWAAYANFEEKEKGSLEKGKFADFIILDRDIMKCNIHEVLETKVLSTYINGEKVYSFN